MSELKLSPVKDYVVLEREEAMEKTASGLYIPETSQEKPLRGIVVAVGNELSKDTVVKIGRTMLYKKYGITEATINGKDYVIIREGDLLLGL